jgi:hypothetical protein
MLYFIAREAYKSISFIFLTSRILLRWFKMMYCAFLIILFISVFRLLLFVVVAALCMFLGLFFFASALVAPLCVCVQYPPRVYKPEGRGFAVPDEVIGFFNWSNPSSRTMALRSTQPLTEMSTRNLLGSKGRPARKADLTAVYEPVSRKCGSLDVSQPYGPPRPVTRTALLFLSLILLIELLCHDSENCGPLCSDVGDYRGFEPI